jgi:hypothetical protein
MSGGKEPSRARKACDECRRKKVKCEHGQQGADIAPSAGKRKPKTPAPSQETNQGNYSDVNAAERAMIVEPQTGGNHAQSSQAVSERPRRLGAGKRKLSEAYDGDAPSNALQRPRKVAALPEKPTNTIKANTPQVKQRKKPGPKPRKQLESAPINIPDTPETSPLPVERPSPPPQPLSPYTGNMSASIDMAWHQHMKGDFEKRITICEQKWQNMRRKMKSIEDDWDDLHLSMHEAKTFMDEWKSRFLRERQGKE